MQAAFRDGNVSNKRTVPEYDKWCYFCVNIGIDNFLDEFYLSLVDILKVYGHRVLHGCYSNKISVWSYTVSLEWSAIATTYFWKAVPTPQTLAYPPPGTSTSDCTIIYKLNPLPILWVKDTPLVLDVAAYKGYTYSRKGQFLGNLIKIALRFCLHSC